MLYDPDSRHVKHIFRFPASPILILLLLSSFISVKLITELLPGMVVCGDSRIVPGMKDPRILTRGFFI